ncbi:MAG: flagellin N-terminal helical domain-containing protein [Sphingomonas oligoaromativorans]|jgi:flagellar hook-associated protein 3 FlgL
MLNTQYSLQSEIARQQALESQIAQLQTNISSGIQVHVASDDPQAAARIAQIGRQQADETVYTTNVKQGQAITSLLDTNLSGVQNALVQAKTLMLQASNGTMSDSDRQAIITSLQGLQQDLQNFSAQTDSSGNALFVKDGQPTQIPIGSNTTVAAADSYDDVFGSVTLSKGTNAGSTVSIDDIISGAIAGLQQTDPTAQRQAMDDSMNALDDAASHISMAQSDLGVREGRFNAASDALATSATDLKAERSGLEDTDATAAYAEMSSKMTILNAAQSVLASMNKVSLFDKIS